MGREIKRVALDFNHPLNEIWPGYLPPSAPDGMTEEQEDAWYDAFVPTEPPAGDGYQLWENTSEGSPVSPVFADPDDLARWMTQNPCMFAGAKMSSFEAAQRFIVAGWSPSMVITPATGLIDGAEYVALEAE